VKPNKDDVHNLLWGLTQPIQDDEIDRFASAVQGLLNPPEDNVCQATKLLHPLTLASSIHCSESNGSLKEAYELFSAVDEVRMVLSFQRYVRAAMPLQVTDRNRYTQHRWKASQIYYHGYLTDIEVENKRLQALHWKKGNKGVCPELKSLSHSQFQKRVKSSWEILQIAEAGKFLQVNFRGTDLD
jgi:hypothetical protein